MSHTHQQPLQQQNVVRYNEERETPNPKYQSVAETKPVVVDKENGSLNGSVHGSSTGHVDETDTGKLGTLVFKLRYLTERSALVVTVVRCRGLPGRAAMSSTGQPIGNGEEPVGRAHAATDPYVKLQLLPLPEKQHKVKTRYDRMS